MVAVFKYDFLEILMISGILSLKTLLVASQSSIVSLTDMNSITSSITNTIQNPMEMGMSSMQQMSQMAQNLPLNMENMQNLLPQNMIPTDMMSYLPDVSQLAPEQLQIVNDMMSLLNPNSMQSLMMNEQNLHQEAFVGAYRDLREAADIMSTSPESISPMSPNFSQVRDRVMSAIQHLRNSCPICRALNYALNNNPSLLPMFTNLSTNILQSMPMSIPM